MSSLVFVRFDVRVPDFDVSLAILDCRHALWPVPRKKDDDGALRMWIFLSRERGGGGGATWWSAFVCSPVGASDDLDRCNPKRAVSGPFLVVMSVEAEAGVGGVLL